MKALFESYVQSLKEGNSGEGLAQSLSQDLGQRQNKPKHVQRQSKTDKKEKIQMFRNSLIARFNESQTKLDSLNASHA